MSSTRVRSIRFGPIQIPEDAFPDLVERHVARVANTAQLEMDAEVLLGGQVDTAVLASFIPDVCRWGGYPGIAGRILKDNRSEHLRECFAAAIAAVGADGSPADSARAALLALNRIKGLGTPSFASKHLRFLDPLACPVLDDLIHRQCGYAFGPSGYRAYARDCAEAAAHLDAAGIPNPFPRRDCWGAADVDAALFAHLRW